MTVPDPSEAVAAGGRAGSPPTRRQVLPVPADTGPMGAPVAMDRRRYRAPRRRAATVLVLLGVWLAGLAVLTVVVLQRAVPHEELFLDAAAVGGVGWYAGVVTSLGVLGWGVSSCACTVTAYAAHLSGRRAARRAFRSAAILFAVLLADDLLQLHSSLLPDLLGVSKVSVLAALGALGALWLLPAWAELHRTRWELLAASLATFAVSLLVDVKLLGPLGGTTALVVEDGAKFLGILALASWSVMTARDIVRSIVLATTGPELAEPTPEPVRTRPAATIGS